MDDLKENINPLMLCDANLEKLPKDISSVHYNRKQLSAGILHIGVGNFHRAHQAWYLHKLFEKGYDRDWAIIGSGVQDYDAAQREKLKKQDFLSTLIELDPSGCSLEIVGSMIDYVPVERGNKKLIACLANPNIRIVMLTITEGGYFSIPTTMELDTSHPDVQNDIENPEAPLTVFGAIVEALRIRKEKNIGPLTGLCCDNLEGNGNILKKTIMSFANYSDPGLADWIDGQCTFPNSMVDCIVPSTGEKELSLVKSFGLDDKVPVTHENFRQWVIEDNFCSGRPKLEKVGVLFTDDVHDYELMKIRLLNGGHQVICNVGQILNIETIAECMEHPQIGKLFSKVTREEIAINVKSVPNMDPIKYVDVIEKRFSNKEILDTTRRVSFDGSARHPGFIIPSIKSAILAGSPMSGLVFVEAAWARMCQGSMENGLDIIPNDPNWDELQTKAKAARENPEIWINQAQYYGDLASNKEFSEMFSAWFNYIWEKGIEAGMSLYLNNKYPPPST